MFIFVANKVYRYFSTSDNFFLLVNVKNQTIIRQSMGDHTVSTKFNVFNVFFNVFNVYKRLLFLSRFTF